MMPFQCVPFAQLGLSRDEWFIEFMMSAITVGVPALVLFMIFDQIRVSRRQRVAGQLLMRARLPRLQVFLTIPICLLCVAGLAVLAYITITVRNLIGNLVGPRWFLDDLFLTQFVPQAVFSVLFLVALLRQVIIHLEIRQHGVCFGRSFTPWEEISLARWMAKPGRLRLEFFVYYRLFSVRKDDIARTDALLRKHVTVVSDANPESLLLPRGKRLRTFHFQFSLQAMLLAFVIAGLVFGIFAMRITHIRANHEVALRLEKAGAKIESMQGRVWSVDFSTCNPQARDENLANLATLDDLVFLSLNSTAVSDAGLVHVAPLKNLWDLSLVKTPITDAGLKHLAGLVNLNTLMLNQTAVTDAGLDQLKGLVHLKWLFLGNTQITGSGLRSLGAMSKLETLVLHDASIDDAGLESLAGLHGLESVNLNRTRVTDAGLKHLVGLPNLVSLGLAGTKITDRALPELEAMKRLEHLDVTGTGMTAAGVERLRKALPRLQIDFTPPAIGP